MAYHPAVTIRTNTRRTRHIGASAVQFFLPNAGGLVTIPATPAKVTSGASTTPLAIAPPAIVQTPAVRAPITSLPVTTLLPTLAPSVGPTPNTADQLLAAGALSAAQAAAAAAGGAPLGVATANTPPPALTGPVSDADGTPVTPSFPWGLVLLAGAAYLLLS